MQGGSDRLTNISVTMDCAKSTIEPIDSGHASASEHDRSVASQLTFGVTAFERVLHLERIVESLLRARPNARIIVADNGREKAKLPPSVKVVHLPFDCGVSAARNALIDRLETDYLFLLEEDFEFTTETRVERLLDVLEQNPEIGFVGGSLYQDGRKLDYAVNLRRFRETLYLEPSRYDLLTTPNGTTYRPCDMCFNFGLIRREMLREHRWPEELKVGEHSAYFSAVKQAARWRVAHCDQVRAIHHREGRTPTYNRYRGRAAEMLHKHLLKQGITRVRVHPEVALGNEDLSVAADTSTPANSGGITSLGNPEAKAKTLRVGLLTPSFRLGGAERWMLALARDCDSTKITWIGTALTDWAQSDTWLCQQMVRHMPIYAGPIRGEGKHDRNYVQRYPTAAEAITKVCADADVVITWGVCDLKKLRGAAAPKVVLVSHGAGAPTRRAMATCEADADYLVAVSEAARSAFGEAKQSAVSIIHNGIDVERCTTASSRDAIRASWGIGPEQILVGYIGRISPEKNPLAAAQAVQRLGTPYTAVYMGAGSDKRWESTMYRMVDGRGILLPPNDHVGDVLAALDVFMLASPSEGFSLSLTEAWYAGVPTVATRVGAVPELEAVHGPLVVPVSVNPTPDELAAAVRIARSDEFRVTVSRVQTMVCEHFTSVAMARRWTNYLETIAAVVK